MRSADVDTPDTPGPSTNGVNGRDLAGRFLPGNRGGPGNPLAKRVAALRGAMLDAVSEEDIRAIVGKLVELAKAGNVPAAKEVLDRCVGRTLEADLLERLEQLEEVLVTRNTR